MEQRKRELREEQERSEQAMLKKMQTLQSEKEKEAAKAKHRVEQQSLQDEAFKRESE